MEECFKPATLRKVTLLHGRFSRFLNSTKRYQIAQRITMIEKIIVKRLNSENSIPKRISRNHK